jgi:hypothetical protein
MTTENLRDDPWEVWMEKRRARKEREAIEEAAKPKVIPDKIVPARFKFNLGEYLRDGITGKKGYVVVRTEHISGCVQYWLTDKGEGAQVTNDRIIDEGRLERTSTPPFEIGKDQAPGCVSIEL